MDIPEGDVTSFSDAVRDMVNTYHSGPEGVRACGTWWKMMTDKARDVDPHYKEVLISVVGSLAVWATHYYNPGDELPKLLADQYEPVREFVPKLINLASNDPHGGGREEFGQAISDFLDGQPEPYAVCLYGAMLDLLEPALEEAQEAEGGMVVQAAEAVWECDDHEQLRRVWDALPNEDGELTLQVKVLLLIAARAVQEHGNIPTCNGLYGPAVEFVAFQLGLSIVDHYEIARGIASGFLMTCPVEASHILAAYLVDYGKRQTPAA